MAAASPEGVTRPVTHTLMGGSAAGRRVVKRSRVLEEAHAEADARYEETPLARRAARARPRLAVLLLVGAGGFALEAVLARSAWMGLGAATIALVAWRAWKGTLAGVIAAALVATLGALIPFALLFVGERAFAEKLVMGFVIAWGLALLPDVLTLIRDAELQHAYGRWARRDA